MEILKEFRSEIDQIDDEIMQLFGKRYDVIRRVAKVKQKHNIPSILQDRVDEVRDRNIEHGKKYDLDSEFIGKIYTIMIDHACNMENNIMDKINGK